MQNIFVEHLEILACPACRDHLRIEDQRLACRKCGAVYPTDEGIPLFFRRWFINTVTYFSGHVRFLLLIITIK